MRPRALHASLALALALAACSDDPTSNPDAGPDQSVADLYRPPDRSPPDGHLAGDKLPPPMDKAPPVDLPNGPDKASPMDAAPLEGGAATDQFPSGDAGVLANLLDGTWLVGWIGGLNRFSWVRFEAVSCCGGKAHILAGKMSGGTVPYWNCTGSTTWNITSKPMTFQLHFPSSTCHPNGLKSASFTLSNYKAYSGTYPKGATHHATLTTAPGSPTQVTAYKYPASQCNKAMTSCKDPFAP